MGSKISKPLFVILSKILTILGLVFFSFLILVGQFQDAKAKDSIQNQDKPALKYKILSLPRLSADLPDGTLAWATIDQLHPTQSQTGRRTVKERRNKFEDLLKEDGDEFSKKLFKELREHYVVPVILANTPEYDTRHGHLSALGFMTDRHHTTQALAELYLRTYGKKAIYKPIYDEKDRPLNFVLVRVVSNKTHLSTKELENFLTRKNRSYMDNWTRSWDGGARIREIDFRSLPETVLETTDNPFRGFVSDMQERGIIPKNQRDFSQFRIAESILENKLATWDEVSHKPGNDEYEEAVDRVKKYYKNRTFAVSCKKIFRR
jgi:hypothetical protein